MSCGVKQIILDTHEKELHLRTLNSVVEELHITTHWKDMYRTPSDISDIGSWMGHSNGTDPVVVVEAPGPVNCWKREITSMSVFNPNQQPVEFIVEMFDGTDSVIVVQRTLLAEETWTFECICCDGVTPGPTPPGEGIDILQDGILVESGVGQLNLLSPTSAEPSSTPGMVDIYTDVNRIPWHVSQPFSVFYAQHNIGDYEGPVEIVLEGETDRGTGITFNIDAGTYDISKVTFIGNNKIIDAGGPNGTPITLESGVSFGNNFPNCKGVTIILFDTVSILDEASQLIVLDDTMLVCPDVGMGGTGNAGIVITGEEYIIINLKNNTLVMAPFGVPVFSNEMIDSSAVFFVDGRSQIGNEALTGTTGQYNIQLISSSTIVNTQTYPNIDIALLEDSRLQNFIANISTITADNVRDAIEELWNMVSGDDCCNAYLRDNQNTRTEFIETNGLVSAPTAIVNDVYLFDGSGSGVWTIDDSIHRDLNKFKLIYPGRRGQPDFRATVLMDIQSNTFFHDLVNITMRSISTSVHNIQPLTTLIRTFTDVIFESGSVSLFTVQMPIGQSFELNGNFSFSNASGSTTPILSGATSPGGRIALRVDHGFIDSNTIGLGNPGSENVYIEGGLATTGHISPIQSILQPIDINLYKKFGEMSVINNTTESVVIGQQGVPYPVNTFTPGLLQGFSFTNGENVNINSVTDMGAGIIRFDIDPGTSIEPGDIITITDTVYYNGHYIAVSTGSDMVTVNGTFNGTDTGVLHRPATLTAEQFTLGNYRTSFSFSGTSIGNNKDYIVNFLIYKATTNIFIECQKCKTRIKTQNASEWFNASSNIITDISPGDKIALLVTAIGHTDNIMFGHCDIVIG